MDRDVFIIAMSITAAYFFVPIMLGILAARTEDKKNPNTMRYPSFFLVVGMMGAATFSSVPIAVFFLPDDPNETMLQLYVVYSIVGIVDILSFYLMLLPLNWRLIFDEDALIYKNIFGIKRRYQYSEISKIYADYKMKTKMLEKYRLYIGKKKITVDYLAKNFGSFERLIKKRLKSAKNPIKIEVKETKF